MCAVDLNMRYFTLVGNRAMQEAKKWREANIGGDEAVIKNIDASMCLICEARIR